MSKTVLSVVREGIEKVDIDPIDDCFIKILEDFYSNCCVIDPKRGYIPSSGKYSQTYSCFDRNRKRSTLDIKISDDNVISINESGEDIQKTAEYNPNEVCQDCETLHKGILTLINISGLSTTDKILAPTSKIVISSTGGELITSGNQEYYEKFYYDQNKNILTGFSSVQKQMQEEKICYEDVVKKMYYAFKQHGN